MEPITYSILLFISCIAVAILAISYHKWNYIKWFFSGRRTIKFESCVFNGEYDGSEDGTYFDDNIKIVFKDCESNKSKQKEEVRRRLYGSSYPPKGG